MKSLIFALIGSMVIGGTALSQTPKGEDLVKQYGCFSCHNIYGPKNAPGFKGISFRAKKSKNPEEYIISAIKNGSKGKWPRFKSMVMPSFKNISDKELKIIAEWILSIPPKKAKNLKN